MPKGKKDKDFDPTGLLGGTLDLLGLKIDIEELLTTPEKVQKHLEELREKLKAAGAKESLSDEEWKGGRVVVSGHIRTHGLLGEREFHVGTTGGPGVKKPGKSPEPPEVVEPPVDVFDEKDEIVIIADVPGVGPEDVDIKVEGALLSLTTKPGAKRGYHKELRLDAEVDAAMLRSTCRNGVLEVRLRKAGKPQ